LDNRIIQVHNPGPNPSQEEWVNKKNALYWAATGPAASQAFVGDPLLETIRPTLVRPLVATSYLMAPASRRLGESITLSTAARKGVGS
jgi:hypothetical protein